MSNYFEKLYNPIPFYRAPFIEELIIYISKLNDRYTTIFYSVLQWVRAVVKEDEHADHILCPESRSIPAAAIHAENNYKAAVYRRDFADTTRWRYIMCAVRDYARSHYARGEY